MSVFPQNNAWSGSVVDFLNQTEQTLVTLFSTHYRSITLTDCTQSHITAWIDTIRIMQRALQQMYTYNEKVHEWIVVFEYELPRERGRRPDVILLTDKVLFVIEAKGYPSVEKAHVDQVHAYARDLIAYHSETQAMYGNYVVPVLLLTRGQNIRLAHGTVQVVSGNFLADLLAVFVARPPARQHDPVKWLEGEYQPLPSLVNAARIIFRHEEFPHIHRAASSGIDDALRYIKKIAQEAEKQKERHIIFVTGVPGAGKTLVGIRFVYEYASGEKHATQGAVMLSGNGPLVKVLQHALKSTIFVQDVHGFLKEYTRHNAKLPHEHVIIYDEAQRAWDAARSAEKRGTELSEPDDFLAIGSKQPEWAVMIALIGQGQEIHLGEEAGLQQWDAAIAYADEHYHQKWVVHAPGRLREHFQSAKSVNATALLDLDVSLRTHVAEDVQNWVAMLLNQTTARDVAAAGNRLDTQVIEKLSHYASAMRIQGYTLYLTRDLDRAKQYVRTRYAGETEKRYGLLASSKAKNLMEYGVLNEFQVNRMLREGPWFNDDPESPKSCCQLEMVATEFQSQGLELDMPIVCWGDDMVYQSRGWFVKTSTRSKAVDPRRLRMNAYRVLLSRGRDGMVLFVPPMPSLDATADVLLQAGCQVLDTDDQIFEIEHQVWAY